jgi:arylsulfatase A
MFNSSGPLRGGKRDLYEGGIRVPMIAHWPAGIAKPGTSDHASAFWDFLPTACELAGHRGARRASTASPSLPPSPARATQRAHDFLYWEFHEQGTRRALRQGDWKLVQYDVAKNGKPDSSTSADLAETNDLAGQEPERVAAMLKIMEATANPRRSSRTRR